VEPIKFKIDDKILAKMLKFYDSQMVPIAADERLLLKAHAIDCEIAVDEDMTATFTGGNAMHEAANWSSRLAKKIEDEMNRETFCTQPHIGAAETGSGDYIGPLCVVACYLDEDGIAFMKTLNIEDVDKLTNKEIVTYAQQIKQKTIASLLVLDNSHYNNMIDKGINQANIRARLFNTALVNVLQKTQKTVDFKVMEKYISPKTYYNYLKNEVIIVRDLKFEKDADKQYLAVLAAEIISRYAYLQYYASMTKSLKTHLARGTGASVDSIVVQLAKKYGEKILTKIVKLNFTDTKRVRAALAEDRT